jgi:CrcB protein
MSAGRSNHGMIRLAVAAGGIAGAWARYGTGLVVESWLPPTFPWATLGVNVAGSWLLALLMQALPATIVSPAVRLGLTVGFCGGFTTYSTFALETVTLAQSGHPLRAGAYVASSLALCLCGSAAGLATGSALIARRPSRSATIPAHAHTKTTVASRQEPTEP